MFKPNASWVTDTIQQYTQAAWVYCGIARGARQELANAVFEWIETWHNPRRRHSSPGNLPPIDYERQHTRSWPWPGHRREASGEPGKARYFIGRVLWAGHHHPARAAKRATLLARLSRHP